MNTQSINIEFCERSGGCCWFCGREVQCHHYMVNDRWNFMAVELCHGCLEGEFGEAISRHNGKITPLSSDEVEILRIMVA